jgi:hypothetical protein
MCCVQEALSSLCSTDWLVSDFSLHSSVPPGERKESTHTSNQTTITSFYILSKLFLTNQPTIQLYIYMARGTECIMKHTTHKENKLNTNCKSKWHASQVEIWMTGVSGKGSTNVKNKDLPSCNTSSYMALQSHVDLCLLHGLLPIRSVF